MRFLYKVWSGSDSFTPSKILERMLPGKRLRLGGWRTYLDLVEPKDEVWVYFYGPGVARPGVYVQGTVLAEDVASGQVLIRTRFFDADEPLTDATESTRIADLVAPRGRQVFLVPEDWTEAPQCDVDSVAKSCAKHLCDRCVTWQRLPRIGRKTYTSPPRLQAPLVYVPAYWVIPRRCYLPRRSIRPLIRQTSDLFYRFKTGDKELAFPFALGIYSCLVDRELDDFDCIVPIPLSPEKDERGEAHRTRLLARELAPLLGSRVVEALSLSQPISKRALRLTLGLSIAAFETAYWKALEVDEKIKSCERILLVDDVATDGSTLDVAIQRLKDVNPDVHVVASTAGQMIKKAVLRNERSVAI